MKNQIETLEERKALCLALLQPINELALNEKLQIVASTNPNQPITINDLMNLSDSQLRELEEVLIPKTKSRKRMEKNEKQYYKTHGFTLEHKTENKNFKIK